MLEPVGVALHHGRARIARAQQAAEHRVELDEDQTGRIDAVLDQRLGHRPRARTKLDDGAVGLEVDLSRHGAREELAGRHHGAGRQRLLEPGSDELDFVVDRSERLLGETQRRLNRHDGLSRMTHRPLGHGMVTILSRVKALESRVK